MRQILNFLLSIAIVIPVIAQVDTSFYRVTMNSGEQFNCKILELKKGEYIRVIKEDSSIYIMGWEIFKDYQNISEINRREREKLKRKREKEEDLAFKRAQAEKAKPRTKHKSWLKGFIVLDKGDTLLGKIKPKNDYADRTLMANNDIVFANKEDIERVYSPKDFKEFFLYDEPEEYKKFISVYSIGEKVSHIYRVITDGKCKLISHTISAGPSAMFGNSMVGNDGLEVTLILYEGVFYKIFTQGSFDTSSNFTKKCSVIFGKCPALVKKIQDKKYTASDLSSIVREFNSCLPEGK